MKSDDKQEARFRPGVILAISLGLNMTPLFAAVLLRQKPLPGLCPLWPLRAMEAEEDRTEFGFGRPDVLSAARVRASCRRARTNKSIEGLMVEN